MKNCTKIVLCLAIIGLTSFTSDNQKVTEFEYPNRKGTTVLINLPNFDNLTKEWRGEDYYFMGKSSDSIICSVLYYKLNKEEVKTMVKPFGGQNFAGIPFTYFSESSNLKKFEKNQTAWGNMEDDFMFRQCDILEIAGQKIRQKNMYAYGMLDKDLFVNIHLSKINYTANDSTVMREILNSITKKK